MEEEKKQEETKEVSEQPKQEKEPVETTEKKESTETNKPEVERTSVEEEVSEQVNSGDAKSLAKLNEKLDIVISLLSNKEPNFDANDSEEKAVENSDDTSKAELEAIENILD